MAFLIHRHGSFCFFMSTSWTGLYRLMSRYYLSKIAAGSHASAEDYAKEFLFNALNIGEEMMLCGAEISRVEDSIRRMCKAYGAERVDVIIITTAIIATVYSPMFGTVTQTRRVGEPSCDLWKLSRLNSLSRQICGKMPVFDIVEREFADIKRPRSEYPRALVFCVYAFISASFTLLFGGTAGDAIASGLIGLFFRLAERFSKHFGIEKTAGFVLWSFIGGSLAILMVKCGLGHSSGLISIGNIMLLMPGLKLTNSIRDMFSGDMLSAILKFADAFLQASLIALGFALPEVIW